MPRIDSNRLEDDYTIDEENNDTNGDETSSNEIDNTRAVKPNKRSKPKKPKFKRGENDELILTPSQARMINKKNRTISNNINSLLDDINVMTHGISRTDKIESLKKDFDSLMTDEIDSVTKATGGDTTSFLTKLLSENRKYSAQSIKDLEKAFNADDGQLQGFLEEQYRNRLIKQADLHQIASQLSELKQAITITRDAVVAADVVDGRMTRTLSFRDASIDDERQDYMKMVESVEKKFDLQRLIKEFIVPRSLEYGEYYCYVIPYAKLFEDFAKEKNDTHYMAYRESVEGKTVKEILSSEDRKGFEAAITESVKESPIFEEYKITHDNKNPLKGLPSEIDQYLENIRINNDPIPLPVIEEGVEATREYFTEFVESTSFMKEAKGDNGKGYTFDKVMQSIDGGVQIDPNWGNNELNYNGTANRGRMSNKDTNFGQIKDCYIKLMSPMNLLPLEIMDETIGYYWIIEEDITPLAGILTSTMYYDKFDQNRNENNVLSTVAETIVRAFDKKFLIKNMKFKKLIAEAISYYKLNNRRIRFQFIPKEYIIPFKVNKDEHGRGVSVIQDSLFYAKLYLMHLLFKMITILLNSNDTKVNYVKQSGIDKNIANKIQDIIRIKQQRQITMQDMFSYTTLIKKIGQGAEMYIPLGKNDVRGIETEILSGQDVDLNTPFMEMLKKGYISATPVPDVLLNMYNEAEFAKTIEQANNRFRGTVVGLQLSYNPDITILYQTILRYCTSIPENIIQSLEFNFMQPKHGDSSVTAELISTYESKQNFVTQLYFGNDQDDEEIAPAVQEFRKLYAKESLPMLGFNNLDELYRQAVIEGKRALLDPDNQTEEEQQ